MALKDWNKFLHSVLEPLKITCISLFICEYSIHSNYQQPMKITGNLTGNVSWIFLSNFCFHQLIFLFQKLKSLKRYFTAKERKTSATLKFIVRFKRKSDDKPRAQHVIIMPSVNKCSVLHENKSVLMRTASQHPHLKNELSQRK